MKSVRSLCLGLACLLIVQNSVATARPRAPEISGVNVQDGKAVKLSRLRGQVVFVDFWASWCTPCRKSLPLFESLQQELEGQGFSMIGINMDTDEKAAQRAMQSAGIHYPVLRDPEGKIALDYEVDDMPSAYLIDRHGRMHSVHRGFRTSTFPALRAEIERLLQEKAP